MGFGQWRGLPEAIGAWTGGVLHNWIGSYDAVIGFSVVSLLLAVTPFLTLRAARTGGRHWRTPLATSDRFGWLAAIRLISNE